MGKGLLGCLVVLLLAALACCCSGTILLYYTPEILVALATSDHPLPIAPIVVDEARNEATMTRMSDELERTRTTTLSGDELTRIVASSSPGTLVRIAVQGGRASLDLSVPLEESAWVNVHVVGRFVIEHGWFTDVQIDEARLAEWELGAFVAGQQLAANVNQSLAQERAKDSGLDEMFSVMERVAVDEDTFRMTLTEGGLAQFRKGP